MINSEINMYNPSNYNIALNLKEETNLFSFFPMGLSIPNNEILSMGVCSKFLIISNKLNKVFRWIYDQDDSLRTAYSIPLPDKERGHFSRFFCQQKGYHTIFKHNRYYYYFNIHSNSIKLLHKLNDLIIESIAFNENAGEYSTDTILLGNDNGIIYGYQIDYDLKNEKVTEKITEFIKLKHRKPINGLAVR